MAPALTLPSLLHSWRLQGPPTFRHALTIALTLHGLLLLAVGFTFSQTTTTPEPYLDVTLIQQPGADAPSDAEALAQFDQQGSGDDAALTQSVVRRVEPAPEAQPDTTGTETSPAGTQAPARALHVLSVHVDSSAALSEPGEHADADHSSTATSEERAALRARLQQAQQLYSRMPRTLRTTALSARAASHAGYLADWVERVEAVGNQYYPAEARRQQLYGELQLAVTLLPDGHIADIEVLRSSGHALLDQSAQDTLRRAAPFAPFPPDMAADWDRFEIIRTWQFIPGHAVSTLP